MKKFCGLDFGTSNSTIGIYRDHACQLVNLENNKPTIRSAIFCDVELKQIMFGQEAINSYLEGNFGRLMMSLKSVLGSSLMDEETIIFNESVSYTRILSHFLRHIKSLAELENQQELTQVVLGRPVHFYDNDLKQDQRAQDTLEKIARDIGFRDVSFQFEPIAAALAYETKIQKEQLALIVDMGGGTSDFTVIRLHPNQLYVDRSRDVLANCGIHIAGTDFDQRLSLHSVMPLLGMNSCMRGSSSDIEVPSALYHDLTTWHTLNNLYTPKTISHIRTIRSAAYAKNLFDRLIHLLETRGGHHALDQVETAKQKLSDQNDVVMQLFFIERNLTQLIKRQEFNQIMNELFQKIIHTIKHTIQIANVNFSDINAIFYTGGSTQIPKIRASINALFKEAEVIQGDAFGSVGMGLTIDAHRKYGM